MKKIMLIALLVFPMLVRAVVMEPGETILELAGVRGGLVVVLGCPYPELLETLGSKDAFLVHGLDADAGNVARARAFLHEKKRYGPVTVSHLDGATLPYVNNLVNVIVLSGKKPGVSREEMMRVLAPGGVIIDNRKGKPTFIRKAMPKNLDEWTHYLYDATNNAVSRDRVVAPPRGLQWTCGPEYARSHEHFGSVSAMVSTAGRVFYIIDEGPISSVFFSPKWRLVARDAFSGVLLWKQPIENWESPLRGFRSGPPEIGRRLVARGGRIYVALNYGEAVKVLDAATGKTCKVLEGTEGARELLLQGGMLYVLADDMTADDHDKRKNWINRHAPLLKSYQFPKEPIPMYGVQRIMAVDVEKGAALWTRKFEKAGDIMPATLAVSDGQVCFQTMAELVCLNAADGKDCWRSKRPVAKSRFSWSTPTLVVSDGVVLTIDRMAAANVRQSSAEKGSEWIMDNAHQTRKQPAEMVAFSLKDGKERWRAPYFENYDTQLDIFVINGVVWTGDLRHKRDPGFTQGRSLQTGKVVREISNNQQLYGLQMGHHRCYRNKATERFLLLGRDGIEFIDPQKGTGEGNWWVRGTCQYGIMPANGLIYVPQHSCACHPEEKLIGFNVLAPQPGLGKAAADKAQADPGANLKQGPAYGKSAKAVSGEAGGWPTYRGDPGRSGFQDLPAPRSLSEKWIRRFSAPLTAPVVGPGGRVFMAETDWHRVHALSADDGKVLWSFTADGRIDSPPSIHDGLCVFGTRSGFVYCLRAADGALVWRFHVASKQRRIYSYKQLESVWPVHGSVLIEKAPDAQVPLVYFAAGRSSHIDGGIQLFALELATGKVVHQANVTMDPAAEGKVGVIKQRMLPDVLSSQKGQLYMRNLCLDGTLAPQQKKIRHLYAPNGFLDKTWWHRTYWIYGTAMMSAYGGWPRVGNMVPAGRLLAMDGGSLIYGYGRMSYRAGGGHVHTDATRDYKLFAEVLTPAPRPKPKKQAAPGQRRNARQPAGRREVKWSMNLPFVARAMVLARDAILVAGGRFLTESAEQHGPGTVWIVSREDGARRLECKIPAPAELDGMAFAKSGLFITMIDGSVIRLDI